ncbi:hypothetical protein BDV93DRAFT_306663 [Ceratobasidium sp. AG-I]|nr:hypothetical protein BDV93DRAFT_306663 [Ceratobasidium sp. AG-I]
MRGMSNPTPHCSTKRSQAILCCSTSTTNQGFSSENAVLLLPSRRNSLSLLHPPAYMKATSTLSTLDMPQRYLSFISVLFVRTHWTLIPQIMASLPTRSAPEAGPSTAPPPHTEVHQAQPTAKASSFSLLESQVQPEAGPSRMTSKRRRATDTTPNEADDLISQFTQALERSYAENKSLRAKLDELETRVGELQDIAETRLQEIGALSMKIQTLNEEAMQDKKGKGRAKE